MAHAFINKKIIDGNEYISVIQSSHKEDAEILYQSEQLYIPLCSGGQVSYKEPNTMSTQGYIESKYQIGELIKHVWRPGLFWDLEKHLEIKTSEKQRSKKDLKILIENLHEILMFVEPDGAGLSAYSHKIRELLIFACMEVENYLAYYMRLGGETKPILKTNDYFRLCDKLYLKEYIVKFNSHPLTLSFSPFSAWSSTAPTQTLPWYDSYNKT